MSNIQNTVLLENMYESFKEFLYKKDYENAKKTIDQIAECGFVKEAISMCKELLTYKMTV